MNACTACHPINSVVVEISQFCATCCTASVAETSNLYRVYLEGMLRKSLFLLWIVRDARWTQLSVQDRKYQQKEHFSAENDFVYIICVSKKLFFAGNSCIFTATLPLDTHSHTQYLFLPIFSWSSRHNAALLQSPEESPSDPIQNPDRETGNNTMKESMKIGSYEKKSWLIKGVYTVLMFSNCLNSDNDNRKGCLLLKMAVRVHGSIQKS